MLDSNNPPADQADKGLSEQPPVSGGTGQGQPNTEAPYKLPEKFKGKTPEQIADAYIELEKKLGEQSTTVEEAKKIKDQTDTMLRAIWSDPDTYRKVETAIKRYTTGELAPDTAPDAKPNKGDEEAKGTEVSPDIKDLKTAEENRVLGEFYTKFGYNRLSETDKKAAYSKLFVTLAEILDPGGKRPVREIINSLPLSKLPRFLENAHFLANKDQVVENARRSALLDQRSNDSATIGSFAASSGQSVPGVRLSNREREIASKMGVSEEAYAKRKGEIEKEVNAS